MSTPSVVTAAPPPLLALRGVSKAFGRGKGRTLVLENINLDVHDGELVAIVGFSGSGKSTLLSILAGLIPPDTGSALMNGVPILGPGLDRSVFFQSYGLLPWLNAYDNVYLAVEQVMGESSRADKRARTEQLLALVKLSAARAKRPHELSGGMRQRVALARTFATNAPVLLLDEPLGALDALTRAGLQDELGRLCAEERKTVLLITNDVDEGILLADRVIPLDAGPAASMGPSIRIDLPKPRVRALCQREASFKALRNEVISYLLGPGRKKDNSKDNSVASTDGRAAGRTAVPQEKIGVAA